MERNAALDLRLALLLLVVVGLNLPYLPDRIVPIHDTFYNFANFQIFYSEFFFHGDLASWYPYGTFGLPSDLEQIASLGPAGYLMGLLGGALRLRDALLLFKLSVMLEQVALVFGVYLLSRRLFPTRATALVLGVAAAGSAVWITQQWWDLRIYYLLPLVLYFVASFLASRRPAYFWLAGITGVAWAVGLPAYVTPLLALVMGIIVGVAVGRDLRATAALLASPARANLLTLVLFVAAASAYLYFVSHALDHTILHAPNRDPLTGKVDPETFRTYGGSANLVVIANALLFGWPLQMQWGSGADNSCYIGLLPLLGFAIAVARERDRLFVGLSVSVVALVALSFGGVFTRAAYYLPGMSYYRHVGLVYGLVKVLLLLASGYGLERLWALGRPRFTSPLLLVVAAAFLLEGVVSLPRLLEGPGATAWISSWGGHVLVRLCVYGAAVALSQLGALPIRGALVAALLLDLLVFQFAFYRYWAPDVTVRNARLLEATRVREPYYQPERLELPAASADPQAIRAEPEGSRLAFALATRRGPKQIYWYVYQFANLDPCESQYRTDYLPAGVDRLLALGRKQGVDVGRILGCGAPKLRLASAVRFADSTEQAEQALLDSLRGGAGLTVIERAAGSPPPPGPASGARSAGRVRATRFALGELEAELDADPAQGAWLVYADAYHPGWRASVDGSETPVYPADLAFKAVWVPPGASRVRFWFDHGANGVLRYAVAGFGSACGLGLLALLGASLLRGPRADGRRA